MPLVAFGMVFTSWRADPLPRWRPCSPRSPARALSLIAVLRAPPAGQRRSWGWSAGLYVGGITAIIAVT